MKYFKYNYSKKPWTFIIGDSIAIGRDENGFSLTFNFSFLSRNQEQTQDEKSDMTFLLLMYIKTNLQYYIQQMWE